MTLMENKDPLLVDSVSLDVEWLSKQDDENQANANTSTMF